MAIDEIPSDTIRILLAVDDDPVRAHAIRAVTDWLPPDADIVVLHVGASALTSGSLAPTANPVTTAGHPGYPVTTAADLSTEAAVDVAARETARRAAAAVDGEARVEKGYPARTIVRVAEEIEADLIVIGTGDRSWLSRLFEPSVSMSVTSDAPCSVLVVRPPDS